MDNFIFIGDKKQFAIEYMVYQKTPYLMGKMCFWANNLYIGNRDEEVMLLTVRYYLILRTSQLELLRQDKFQSMTPEEVYNYIYEREYNHTRYLLTLCESFDNFSTVFYPINDKVNLVWKLYEDSSYKYHGYPLGLHFASIDIGNFCNIINKFESDINALA